MSLKSMRHAFHARIYFATWWIQPLPSRFSSMRTPTISLLALLASLSAAACGDKDLVIPTLLAVNPSLDGTVRILDECDPASFNAALGAGTCTRQGTMTLSQFNAELAATFTV